VVTGVEAKRILIVDDEAELTESLIPIFMQNGYDVRIAVSAEEAIDSIAIWIPDLALIDVGLPRMNGIDLAVAVRKVQPNCRVVLFSGQETTEELLTEAARQGNFFEFLAKPLHPMFMLDYVASRLAARPPKKLAN
jgi:DNA-binding NtrC family response regulator